MSEEELYGVLDLVALVLERVRKTAEGEALTPLQRAEVQYAEARAKRALACHQGRAGS